MSGAALVVMAQRPIPGQVKTRLQPYLTPTQSAELYLAFIKDAIDLAMSAKGFTPFISYASVLARSFFEHLAPAARLVPQDEGDIGRRMHHTFVQMQSLGYSSVVIVGSDLPALQPSHIEQARISLEEHEVCLGPAQDGGYYLIGAHRAHEALFEGIAWSTPSVLARTMAAADRAGLSLGLIDGCSDIDTVDDLRALFREIQRLRRTRGARVPEHTAAALEDMALQAPVL